MLPVSPKFVHAFVDTCLEQGLDLEKTAALFDRHLVKRAFKSPAFLFGYAEELERQTALLDTAVKAAEYRMTKRAGMLGRMFRGGAKTMRKAQRGGLYKNIIPLTAAATAVGAPIVADYNNWQPAAGTTGHSLIPESGVDALLGAIPGVALGMLPGPFRRLGRSMPAKYRLPLFGAAGAALGFAGGQKKVYSAPSIAEAGELGLFDAQTPTNPGSQGGKTTINPYTGTAVPTAAGAAGGALGMGRSSTLAPMRQQLNQVDAQIAQLRQQANSLRSQGSARGNLAAYDLSNQLLALEKQRASILQLTSRETERLERIRQERLQRLATLQAENSAWASRHTGRVADTNALIDSATNGGGWGSAFSRALLEWGGRPQLERTLGAQDASETLNNRILQQMNSLSGGPVR